MLMIKGVRCMPCIRNCPDPVRKSKNFTDSKIFDAKTFRIKRVNRDTFDFATKVCKIRELHIFLANVHNVKLDGV